MSKKKKFFYGFFTDIGISGVKIMKMLLLIPLVINYTSSELYGIYLSMLSVVGLLGLIDLGAGMFIIKELAKDNSEKIKIKTFASVSNLIILNTLLILIVGVIIYPLVLNFFLSLLILGNTILSVVGKEIDSKLSNLRET